MKPKPIRSQTKEEDRALFDFTLHGGPPVLKRSALSSDNVHGQDDLLVELIRSGNLFGGEFFDCSEFFAVPSPIRRRDLLEIKKRLKDQLASFAASKESFLEKLFDGDENKSQTFRSLQANLLKYYQLSSLLGNESLEHPAQSLDQFSLESQLAMIDSELEASIKPLKCRICQAVVPLWFFLEHSKNCYALNSGKKRLMKLNQEIMLLCEKIKTEAGKVNFKDLVMMKKNDLEASKDRSDNIKRFLNTLTTNKAYLNRTCVSPFQTRNAARQDFDGEGLVSRGSFRSQNLSTSAFKTFKKQSFISYRNNLVDSDSLSESSINILQSQNEERSRRGRQSGLSQNCNLLDRESKKRSSSMVSWSQCLVNKKSLSEKHIPAVNDSKARSSSSESKASSECVGDLFYKTDSDGESVMKDSSFGQLRNVILMQKAGTQKTSLEPKKTEAKLSNDAGCGWASKELRMRGEGRHDQMSEKPIVPGSLNNEGRGKSETAKRQTELECKEVRLWMDASRNEESADKLIKDELVPIFRETIRACSFEKSGSVKEASSPRKKSSSNRRKLSSANHLKLESLPGDLIQSDKPIDVELSDTFKSQANGNKVQTGDVQNCLIVNETETVFEKGHDVGSQVKSSKRRKSCLPGGLSSASISRQALQTFRRSSAFASEHEDNKFEPFQARLLKSKISETKPRKASDVFQVEQLNPSSDKMLSESSSNSNIEENQKKDCRDYVKVPESLSLPNSEQLQGKGDSERRKSLMESMAEKSFHNTVNGFAKRSSFYVHHQSLLNCSQNHQDQNENVSGPKVKEILAESVPRAYSKRMSVNQTMSLRQAFEIGTTPSIQTEKAERSKILPQIERASIGEPIYMNNRNSIHKEPEEDHIHSYPINLDHIANEDQTEQYCNDDSELSLIKDRREWNGFCRDQDDEDGNIEDSIIKPILMATSDFLGDKKLNISNQSPEKSEDSKSKLNKSKYLGEQEAMPKQASRVLFFKSMQDHSKTEYRKQQQWQKENFDDYHYFLFNREVQSYKETLLMHPFIDNVFADHALLAKIEEVQPKIKKLKYLETLSRLQQLLSERIRISCEARKHQSAIDEINSKDYLKKKVVRDKFSRSFSNLSAIDKSVASSRRSSIKVKGRYSLMERAIINSSQKEQVAPIFFEGSGSSVTQTEQFASALVLSSLTKYPNCLKDDLFVKEGRAGSERQGEDGEVEVPSSPSNPVLLPVPLNANCRQTSITVSHKPLPADQSGRQIGSSITYNSEADSFNDMKRRRQSDSDYLMNAGKEKIYQERTKTISLEDFAFVKELGKGAYGKVYLVFRKSSLDVYALKVIQFSEKANPQVLTLLHNEISVLKVIKGEFLAQAYFSFVQQRALCVVMEFLQGGDFRGLLDKIGRFDEKDARHYVAHLVMAVEELHLNGVIHRDLKPENLLLDKAGKLKLADFGLSEFRKQIKKDDLSSETSDNGIDEETMSRRDYQQRRRKVGTPDYIPPEVLFDDFQPVAGHSEASLSDSEEENLKSSSSSDKYLGEPNLDAAIDWWAVGCLLYEFLVGISPFSDNELDKVFQNIKSRRIEWPEIGREEDQMSPEAKNLIERLLDPNPATRLGSISSKQIHDHPFFRDFQWKRIAEMASPYQVSATVPKLESRIPLSQILRQGHNALNESRIAADELTIDRIDLLYEMNLKRFRAFRWAKKGQL
jgi:serine/threonine protein kinase